MARCRAAARSPSESTRHGRRPDGHAGQPGRDQTAAGKEPTQWSVALAVAQVRGGADAIKISSPFAGMGFLAPAMYEEFIIPFERHIAEAVKAEGAYVYTHTCGGIGDRLDLMVKSQVSGIECLDPPAAGERGFGGCREAIERQDLHQRKCGSGEYPVARRRRQSSARCLRDSGKQRGMTCKVSSCRRPAPSHHRSTPRT